MNKIKGRNYGEGKFQKHLYGIPRHFRSDYTQKNSPFKGCFGRCEYLISRQRPVLKINKKRPARLWIMGWNDKK